MTKSVLAALLLAGCATAPQAAPGRLPSQREASSALTGAMACVDWDGYTNCGTVRARRIEFSTFHCTALPRERNELAHARCDFSGRIVWNTGRMRRFGFRRIDFYLEAPEHLSPAWIASGTP